MAVSQCCYDSSGCRRVVGLGRLGPVSTSHSTATDERPSDRDHQTVAVRWHGTRYTSEDRKRREQQQRRRARQARQAQAAYQQAEARRSKREQDAAAKRQRREARRLVKAIAEQAARRRAQAAAETERRRREATRHDRATAKRERKEARRWHHHLGECAAWAFSAALLGACAQSWARGAYYPLFWSRGVFPRFWWIDHLPAWDWQRQASSHLVETAANWTVLGREDVSFGLLVAVGLWAVYCWLAAAAAASKCVRKAAQQAAERRGRLAAARKERERQQQERAAAERDRAWQERQARREREDAARAEREALRARREEEERLDSEPPPVTASHHKQWIAQNGLCGWVQRADAGGPLAASLRSCGAEVKGWIRRRTQSGADARVVQPQQGRGSSQTATSHRAATLRPGARPRLMPSARPSHAATGRYDAPRLQAVPPDCAYQPLCAVGAPPPPGPQQQPVRLFCLILPIACEPSVSPAGPAPAPSCGLCRCGGCSVGPGGFLRRLGLRVLRGRGCSAGGCAGYGEDGGGSPVDAPCGPCHGRARESGGGRAPSLDVGAGRDVRSGPRPGRAPSRAMRRSCSKRTQRSQMTCPDGVISCARCPDTPLSPGGWQPVR